MMNTEKYARSWAAVLIALGVGLLGVASVAAFTIIRDPGGSFDTWVSTEEGQGPEAAFTWSSDGRRVEFRDTSTAGDTDLTGRLWDFGDGATSEKANPAHKYGENGEYTVSLEVTSSEGLTSRAETGIAVEPGSDSSGQGELGMDALVDSVTTSVERVAKGIGVAVLVLGMFVVMVMAGGRLLKNGVRALRPIPERISIKVRPHDLERELDVGFVQQTYAETGTGAPDDEGFPAHGVDASREKVGT